MKSKKFSFSTIEDALKDLKKGRMIIVCDDEDRENEGDLIMAAAKVSPEAINFMAAYGRGIICMAVNKEIANKLDLEKPQTVNHQHSHCNFTNSIDAVKNTSTGTSAHDRAETIKQALDPFSTSHDFSSPGHIFPVLAKEGGVLVRAGHTEAASDLAELAGFNPAGVICEIMKEDGQMARKTDLIKFSKKHNLKMITISDLIKYRVNKEKLIYSVATSNLPTPWGIFKMHVYKNKINDAENIALTMGNIKKQNEVIVRVHSECMTGDVFSSLRCDCREQLHKAMQIIGDNKSGAIVYMRQEGRGIGLTNKIKAYELQDRGYDTVEANKMLGLEVDLRHYGLGAQILQDLGIKKIKLLTNNNRKVVGLEGYGLKITETLPLEIEPQKYNEFYLKTKKIKLGHKLSNI